MLRTAVFLVGCLALLGALVLSFTDAAPFAIQLAVAGVLLAGGVAFERWRYKPGVRGHIDPRWQPTGERFFDPETGKPMEVYFDPETGRRQYVETGDRKSG